jgi:hypothetical protein
MSSEYSGSVRQAGERSIPPIEQDLQVGFSEQHRYRIYRFPSCFISLFLLFLLFIVIVVTFVLIIVLRHAAHI